MSRTIVFSFLRFNTGLLCYSGQLIQPIWQILLELFWAHQAIRKAKKKLGDWRLRYIKWRGYLMVIVRCCKDEDWRWRWAPRASQICKPTLSVVPVESNWLWTSSYTPKFFSCIVPPLTLTWHQVKTFLKYLLLPFLWLRKQHTLTSCQPFPNHHSNIALSNAWPFETPFPDLPGPSLLLFSSNLWIPQYCFW